MLEGLEVREINFEIIQANKDFRIDSDFYTKAILKNPNLIYKKIGDCILLSQYGISISMNDNKIGYPIFRMNEIHNMLCDEEVGKYADISEEEYYSFELKHKDVLFNRTNSYEWVGRTGIYYQNDIVKRTFASYLVKFQVNEDVIIPEYLVTFLNTKYGIREIKRRARQSINQTNVNPEEVKEIEIPILTHDFQSKICKCFELAGDYRRQSKRIYEAVEYRFLEQLGLVQWKPGLKTIAIKKNSDFQNSGRLDAEYYQPKYESIENKLLKNGIIPVKECCEIKDSNFIPINDIAYKYIELSNINQYGEITGYTECFGQELPTRARRLVKEGDLLISSIEGSLQSCAIVSKEYDGALCSTGFFVLRPVRMNVETLLLIFKSEVIQNLLKKGCSGTILTAISKEELLKIKLPFVEDKLQKEFATIIGECFKLKTQSKQLLDLAKIAVETAIEQGEEQAIKLLNNHAQ